jgi:tRNA (guanine-N7-)-methyltransferase
MSSRPPFPAASRLPVDHPDYRYPGSRNPYWERLQSLQRLERPNAYSEHSAEKHRGTWRSRFPVDVAALRAFFGTGIKAPAPPFALATPHGLCVEIGCSAGHVLLERAAREPTRLFLGLDWKHKMIHRAAEKAALRGLPNLIFLRTHAERLSYLFAPGEIDELAIFFPDPWPRQSQWKHRYLTADRLEEFARLVKPGGGLHIKTDHAGYFEWIEEALGPSPVWETISRTRDLHGGNPARAALTIPEVTLFERIFIRDGIRIKRLVATKR